MHAWALWILASAVGGAVGGLTFEPLSFVGLLLLFGVIQGAAQAPVVWRYLGGPTGLWIVASCLGWFAGWIVFALLQQAVDLLEIARQSAFAIARLTGSEAAPPVASNQLLQLLPWTALAASQGAILSLRHRASPSLAALWVAAGVAGGILAVLSSVLIYTALPTPGSGDLLLNLMVIEAVGQAVAGALYAAATGVVLAMIARRSAN